MIRLLAQTTAGAGRIAARAALCCLLLVAGLGSTARADILTPLMDRCFDGEEGFDARIAQIESLGYTIIARPTDFRIEGQLMHIAMATLSFGDEEVSDLVRESYDNFRGSTIVGKIFRVGLQRQQFVDLATRLEISLTSNEGNHSCAGALARPEQTPKMRLKFEQTWTQAPGTSTKLAMSDGRTASLSTFSAIWDSWNATDNRPSAFLVMAQ